MAFQCRFTPTIVALLVADLDEQPSWKDAEVLNGFDLGHFDGRSREEKERRGSWGEEKKESRITGLKMEKTHVFACAMTESCEWRGQKWISLGATGRIVCRVACMDILFSAQLALVNLFGVDWRPRLISVPTGQKEGQMRHPAYSDFDSGRSTIVLQVTGSTFKLGLRWRQRWGKLGRVVW